ncbi:DUF3467 domain-containing protein [Falsigemmobacter faecalis]|uniref:DUF3467 domain-containing protein n=1 Tax=Falsigemmobacter faecalis TaxID=2488730 RepID=A0A3P3DMJ8_9RHOB|nr:DUF3467 domain-containing protein [Falsigemmobacter faecalis]RRH73848.1 DUF3467 domain-containing protein [Falsigemmobacter faecalis]
MSEAASSKPKHTTTMNGMSITWNDEKMESLYANIGTATANREEFYFLFGTHQNWRGNASETREIEVSLNTRVVLNPYAAKRFAAILTASIKAYEDQFGKIDI